jgi:nucleoside-diphosphate-sugar epimerase
VIVVAGGTGRLGRLVVDRLRGLGEDVRTMSRADGDVVETLGPDDAAGITASLARWKDRGMTFDPSALVARYPQIAWTTVAEAARRDYPRAA